MYTCEFYTGKSLMFTLNICFVPQVGMFIHTTENAVKVAGVSYHHNLNLFKVYVD